MPLRPRSVSLMVVSVCLRRSGPAHRKRGCRRRLRLPAEYWWPPECPGRPPRAWACGAVSAWGPEVEAACWWPPAVQSVGTRDARRRRGAGGSLVGLGRRRVFNGRRKGRLILRRLLLVDTATQQQRQQQSGAYDVRRLHSPSPSSCSITAACRGRRPQSTAESGIRNLNSVPRSILDCTSTLP